MQHPGHSGSNVCRKRPAGWPVSSYVDADAFLWLDSIARCNSHSNDGSGRTTVTKW